MHPMIRYQYKRIMTDTLAGLRTAERLQAQGWRVIQAGLFSVLMEKDHQQQGA